MNKSNITLRPIPNSSDVVIYAGNLRLAIARTLKTKQGHRWCCEHFSKSYSSPEQLVDAIVNIMNQTYTGDID